MIERTDTAWEPTVAPRGGREVAWSDGAVVARVNSRSNT